MGKGGGGSPTSTQVVQQQIPPFIEDRLKTALGRAESISQEGYLPYDGQRLADFSPDEMNMFGLTRASVGSYNPYVLGGADAIRSGSAAYDGNLIDQYRNDYTGGVLDEIERRANQNLMENVLPGVNDTFIKSGGFGGTRNQDFTLRALRDNQDTITGQQSKVLSDAQNVAFDQASQGLNRQMDGGKALPVIGQMLQNLQGIDLTRLGTIGGTQRTQAQQGLDMQYQDFQTQRDYPKEQLNFLTSNLYGNPYRPNTATSTTTQPQANPYAQMAGIAGSAYMSGQGYEIGGEVKPKKRQIKKPAKQAGIGGSYGGNTKKMGV